MKVIFLNRYFYPDHSATSQILSDLAFFLAQNNHEVIVITSGQLYDEPGARLDHQEDIEGVKVHRVLTTRFGRGNLAGRAIDYASFYISAGWMLNRIASAGDVIVAKTDPPLISVVAARVAKWRGARLVNWIQDLFPEVAEALGVRAVAGPQARLLKRLRNGALRQAARNVVLSPQMAESVARAGAPMEAIRIIPNWADMDAIRPVAAADNPLRRAWGLEQHFVVCYSGNMGRAHEFDTILNAAELLSAPGSCSASGLADQQCEGRESAESTTHNGHIRFLFIGNGMQRSAIEDAVNRRGLNNVSFQPYQDRDKLSVSLGVGDVHLVSLRPELEGCIFPSKFYGILAAGRPVIFVGDPKGELASLIKGEGIGFVVQQGDPRRLADNLVRLAGDPALREVMGQRARSILCDRYTVSVALASWRELLETL